jgi:hypothetical protein
MRLSKGFAGSEALKEMRKHEIRKRWKQTVTDEKINEALRNEKLLRETITAKYGEDIFREIVKMRDYVRSIYSKKNVDPAGLYDKAVLMTKKEFPLFEEQTVISMVSDVDYNYK